MSHLLELRDVQLSYGNITALKGISIDVKQGEITCLLGANGAGKSSTLKAISGMKGIQSGSISFENNDIHKLSAPKINKLGIVQSPEGRQIFTDLSVEENLRIGSFQIKGKETIRKNLERVHSYFPILKDRQKQLAGTLSGGEQQMLAIGRALMASPKLLILDEPSLGLAPLIVKDIFRIVKEINQEGTTVLIVEQNAVQTLKIANYAYVLETGNVAAYGKSEDLLKDEKLLTSYLGA